MGKVKHLIWSTNETVIALWISATHNDEIGMIQFTAWLNGGSLVRQRRFGV